MLASALGMERVMLYARFDQPLAAPELAKIRQHVARRGRGEPVAYITGEREFWSLAFEVTPDVLIPRPDTEVLVEEALARGKGARSIADVGTGSGCLAIALAKELPEARVLALDRSPAALAVAARNAARHGVAERVTPRQSDLLVGLTDGDRGLDLIVANLPYIRRGELASLMPDVRDHEPRLALDGGPDGLDLIRRLIAEAARWLRPGGAIALEAGSDQLGAVQRMLEQGGYLDVRVRKDYAGLDRVASGVLPDA